MARYLERGNNDRFIPAAHDENYENAAPPPAGDERAALLRQALLGARGRVLQFAKQTPPPAAPLRAQRSPRTAPRRACATPFRVLAAPGLRDDFYLDLVCWSRLDVIAVGLGSRVRLYRASNLKELCDVGIGDAVASLAWSPDGRRLAVGCASGRIALYDVGRGVVVTPANGHRGRVGCLDWRGDVLASGSRDRGVACRDVRVSPRKTVARWKAHRQEVCGLRWSPGGDALATGGNDNAVRVWSASKLGAGAQELQGHGAAVKALAWSPHHRGRLATGGGTADRSIKIWDAARGLRLSTVDTGSQVCALAWSSAEDALVSAHGYSLNQILIWRLPELARDGVLAGHGKRVLYLALSPDSRVAVTGAGDESLRFWACFGRRRSGPGGLLECGGIR